MRASTLYAFSVAALVGPALAVPMSMTTVIDLPIAVKSLTVALNAPTEIPNAPMPTDKATTGMMKTWSRPPRLPRVARGPTFRQADYGVSPNMTLDTFAPVQGVEATPSSDAVPPPTHSRRSDDWESNHLSADDYSYNNAAEVDAPQSAPVSGTPSLPSSPGDVSDDTDGIDSDSGSTKDASSALAGHNPVKIASDPTAINQNHLPVQPDLSIASLAIAQALQALGHGRYTSSNAVHQGLNNSFRNSAVPTTEDVSKSHMDVQKANQQIGKSMHHRRVLRPATFLTKFARDVAQVFSRHNLEFNTEALLPTDPKSLNMSDPMVAHEAARKHNIGLVNVDSNQAPKPIAPHPKVDTPVALNSTQTQVNTAAQKAT